MSACRPVHVPLCNAEEKNTLSIFTNFATNIIIINKANIDVKVELIN